jgi:hypothetical protein
MRNGGYASKERTYSENNLYFKSRVMLLDTLYFVGSEELTETTMKSCIFLDIIPCNPLKVNRRFGGKYGRHLFSACFVLISFLTYSHTLKIEAIRLSETSVDFYWTTVRNILENRTPHPVF